MCGVWSGSYLYDSCQEKVRGKLVALYVQNAGVTKAQIDQSDVGVLCDDPAEV